MKYMRQWMLIFLAVTLLVTLSACKKDPAQSPTASTEAPQKSEGEVGFTSAAREPVTEDQLLGAWVTSKGAVQTKYEFFENGALIITTEHSGEEPETSATTWQLGENRILLGTVDKSKKVKEEQLIVIVALEGDTLYCRKESEPAEGFVLRYDEGTEPAERSLMDDETPLVGVWSCLPDEGEGMVLHLEDTGACIVEKMEAGEPQSKFYGEWILENGVLYLANTEEADNSWFAITLSELKEDSFTGAGPLGEMTFTRGE